MNAPPYLAAVITISDRVYGGVYEDRSGKAAVEKLHAAGFAIAGTTVVPDEVEQIRAALLHWAERANLIVTSGGTGCAPRDVTPEATLSVTDRLAPGLPEKMRLAGSEFEPRSWLSRGVAGLRGRCLILNLPGSPKGVRESLDAIAEILPHAVAQAAGSGGHE